MQGQSKDASVPIRSAQVGVNSKGNDRIQLTIGGHKEFGNASLEALIQALTESLDNPRGAKMDIHLTKSENGRFYTGVAFVKPVSEPPQQQTSAPKRFVPRAAAGTPTTATSKLNKTIA